MFVSIVLTNFSARTLECGQENRVHFRRTEAAGGFHQGSGKEARGSAGEPDQHADPDAKAGAGMRGHKKFMYLLCLQGGPFFYDGHI